VQSEQLPTESQVFEDEVLAGAKRADDPTEEMPERHNHGKNIIGTIRIQLCAKSFILYMYDVLAKHNRRSTISTIPTSGYTSASVTKYLPAVSRRVLLKQHFAQYLEEMKGQYTWSVRWYGLIERVQLPKPTRPSLSHMHYTLRSPASTRASARTF
jgi:hypothetical protein